MRARIRIFEIFLVFLCASFLSIFYSKVSFAKDVYDEYEIEGISLYGERTEEWKAKHGGPASLACLLAYYSDVEEDNNNAIYWTSYYATNDSGDPSYKVIKKIDTDLDTVYNYITKNTPIIALIGEGSVKAQFVVLYGYEGSGDILEFGKFKAMNPIKSEDQVMMAEYTDLQSFCTKADLEEMIYHAYIIEDNPIKEIRGNIVTSDIVFEDIWISNIGSNGAFLYYKSDVPYKLKWLVSNSEDMSDEMVFEGQKNIEGDGYTNIYPKLVPDSKYYYQAELTGNDFEIRSSQKEFTTLTEAFSSIMTCQFEEDEIFIDKYSYKIVNWYAHIPTSMLEEYKESSLIIEGPCLFSTYHPIDGLLDIGNKIELRKSYSSDVYTWPVRISWGGDDNPTEAKAKIVSKNGELLSECKINIYPIDYSETVNFENASDARKFVKDKLSEITIPGITLTDSMMNFTESYLSGGNSRTGTHYVYSFTIDLDSENDIMLYRGGWSSYLSSIAGINGIQELSIDISEYPTMYRDVDHEFSDYYMGKFDYLLKKNTGVGIKSLVFGKNDNGWIDSETHSYWYENGYRQGVSSDSKCFSYAGSIRGREIYDPDSDGWYWLDYIYAGAKAVGKEVFMPYIYQGEDEWSDAKKTDVAYESDEGMGEYVLECIKNKTGKWVRYDKQGKMIKGWVTIEGELAELYPEQSGNVYYYDTRTGLMAKGELEIDGFSCIFDEKTGVLLEKTKL